MQFLISYITSDKVMILLIPVTMFETFDYTQIHRLDIESIFTEKIIVIFWQGGQGRNNSRGKKIMQLKVDFYVKFPTKP